MIRNEFMTMEMYDIFQKKAYANDDDDGDDKIFGRFCQ